MKQKQKPTWTILALGLAASAHLAQAAAPSSPQGYITGKAFLNINGTAVGALTSSPKFPDHPDDIFFYPYFEWAATDDISTPPGNWGDNYGGQIVGYFYPPSSGEYTFWISADDGAALYLSTDSDPANKKLIAQETGWSNAREYDMTSGSSDVPSKDSSQFPGTEWETTDSNLGGAIIELTKGQPYYIEALFKEGGGGDNLSVAVMDPGGVIDPFLPIPGEYLSSDRNEGPVTIVTQPQDQTVDERGTAVFNVHVDGTPPYSYQWFKNGEAIADATGLSVTVSNVSAADAGSTFSVEVTGDNGTVTSDVVTLNFVPDTVAPVLLGAKGLPNLTEIILSFSEALTAASAEDVANYSVSSSSGALNITDATLSPTGTAVTLKTAQQTLGKKYTILVNNVQDIAAEPNTIAADSKAVIVPVGKLTEMDGFIVFEMENYDRNLDGLW
ncbi:MAG: PA14 domain-containing protein, partial [Verrucomicrobia bacterium]|nr:PA14 domain-containing protein [Verrucomicrobiota bacterium]